MISAGSVEKDEQAEDLRMFGAPEKVVDDWLGKKPAPDGGVLEVYAENEASLVLFLSLETQWRVGAMGGWHGLDYPALDAVMRMRRIKDRAKAFDAIRAMELAALPILNGHDGPEVNHGG